MKILITGGRGMLGRTLKKILTNYEIIIADLPEADITNQTAFENFVKSNMPDCVIHCAAMTQVDNCESQQELAYKLNVIGSANVAAICHKYNIRLLAISTDYVFNGSLDRPYNELDIPDGGKTIYGQTKFQCEEQIRKLCPNHLILRISWLYGFGGPSFVHTMLSLAKAGKDNLKVVNDQIGNPTSAIAVAKHIGILLTYPEIKGTMHLTCEGEATWYTFAKEIFKLANLNINVIPCATNEYPRPAPRPANSRLEKMQLKLNNLPSMPHWQDALKEFFTLEFNNQ
jgi:dTDP-4-dehydrorhamnose reductase